MTELLDLPNEVLSRISSRLSDADHKSLFSLIYVNKRLNIIATPFLVRRWPLVGGEDALENSPRFDRFALHLLRNPSLRRYIRLLDVEDFGTRQDSHEELAISQDEVQQLVTAGVRDWPALAQLRGMGVQMSEDIDDAFMVLILLWASHLVEFDFTVPLIGSLSQDGEEQLVLCFVSQVARRLRDSPEDAMLDRFPLARLQYVQYKHWDTEFGVQGQFSAPFFYLPNLRTFFGYRIEMTRPYNGESDEDDDDIQSAYLTEFPVGTSTVEEIILNCSDMCLEALETFIRACRRLRTFALDYGSVLDTREVDSSRLAELLVARADSLQNLALDWGHSPTLEITSQGPLEIEQCFRQLHRLEYLELPLYMLCEDGEIGGQTFISLNSQLLPKSLKCLCLVGGAYWKFDSKVGINKMVDSIEAFILKCGPGGEFPHMEALELIYLTDRSHQDNYTQRLKKTGRKKNVRLVFNEFKWRTWPKYG